MVRDILAELEPFDALPVAARDRLAARMRPRTFSAGGLLVRQGDLATGLHVIVRGRVRIERAHPRMAEPLALAEAGAGEVVGELAALAGGRSPDTIRAMDDTDTLELDAHTLRAALPRPALPRPHPTRRTTTMTARTRALAPVALLSLAVAITGVGGSPDAAAQEALSGIQGTECVALAADTGLPATLSTALADSEGGVTHCVFPPARTPGPPARPTVKAGFACNTPEGVTTKSTLLVHPDRFVTLSCER